MGILGNIFGKKPKLEEKTDAFKLNAIQRKQPPGEGYSEIQDIAQAIGGIRGVGTFKSFYNDHIVEVYRNEFAKIDKYREMADMPEIADVIEDACNEAVQEDDDGNILNLKIINSEISENDQVSSRLYEEFDELFYNRIDLIDVLWDAFKTFLIDGRVYLEKIIDPNSPKDGILGLVRLPTETMDFSYDEKTDEIKRFYQHTTGQFKIPQNMEEKEMMIAQGELIEFYPEQIMYINYGQYGKSKKEIFSYLEKAKIAYNQLKLLEISVIIYRLVRSPERFVFKVDVGNMPQSKAMAYVEKVKNAYTQRQSYDPRNGTLTNEPEILSLLDNIFVPVNADGRGSSVETIGGNSAGFAELDDIYYFQRKLYKALKYPMSRVSMQERKEEGGIVFPNQGSVGEITRDEIKWNKFLSRQQTKFEKELLNIFLVHLNMKGIMKELELDVADFKVSMNPPNFYDRQLEQKFKESKLNLYNTANGNEEFSKVWCMKYYLGLSDEDIQENFELMEKDIEYGIKEAISEGGQLAGGFEGAPTEEYEEPPEFEEIGPDLEPEEAEIPEEEPEI